MPKTNSLRFRSMLATIASEYKSSVAFAEALKCSQKTLRSVLSGQEDPSDLFRYLVNSEYESLMLRTMKDVGRGFNIDEHMWKTEGSICESCLNCGCDASDCAKTDTCRWVATDEDLDNWIPSNYEESE